MFKVFKLGKYKDNFAMPETFLTKLEQNGKPESKTRYEHTELSSLNLKFRFKLH